MSEVSVKVSGNCGDGTIDKTNKEIHSPNYPSHYKKNLDCYWTLSSTIGKQIHLNVHIKQIEECGDNCSCDYLKIEGIDDRKSGRNSVSKMLCGSEKNHSIVSKTNILKLHFHSDRDASPMKGFKLTYAVHKN